MKPYYDDGQVTIYHGDCREVLAQLQRRDFVVMVTDPPYGINYTSNRTRATRIARSIEGDGDTAARDFAVDWWDGGPAIVFGAPSVAPPEHTRTNLVWHKPGSGMGDLSLPWKPDYEFIHILGCGFIGDRTTSVLSYPLRVFRGDLSHPHEKPMSLLIDLLRKCPPGAVIDPFTGSGTTLRAAKDTGRRAVGIEIEERYCEIAAKRLAQGVLDLGGVA